MTGSLAAWDEIGSSRPAGVPPPAREGAGMETSDEALIAKLVGQDPILKQLVDDHRDYERRLDEMNRRPYLSTDEDIERKRLQKAKLAGKDKIERILAPHRG
jgi:uncharacterized protein YdcH (DUF465 family)